MSTHACTQRIRTRLCNCPGSGNSEAYTYSYDQFGNRWKQHKTAGTGLEVDYTFNGNNRNTTSGFAYDSAGNLTSDGSCTPCWTYDDAGQLTTGNGGSYLYDGVGRRQQKTDAGGTVHDFVFDGSVPYTEFTSAGFTRQTGDFYTYANGSTYFPRTDHLGTPRVTTDYTGSVQRTETNLAFGDGFSETASPFIDFTGFADGFWDSENNADHFGAREYAKTQGRWLTPDPAGLAVMNPTDPQTWNRYAGWGSGGAGVGAGYNLDLGAGVAGASSTAGVGGGLFHNAAGGIGSGYSGGAFASGAATAYASSNIAGVPTQTSSTTFALGAYAGAGANFSLTNAASSQQLAGPFTTVSINVGVGVANLGVQVSFGGGIWQLSITPPLASVGIGAAGSVVTTNTAATHTGCHK